MLRLPEDLTSISREKIGRLKRASSSNLLNDNIVITLSDLPRKEYSLSSLAGRPPSSVFVRLKRAQK